MQRILLWLTPPPLARNRHRALALILLLAAALGWIDYLTGIWISLQFFYLVPIILSVAWLGRRTACAIAVFCVAVRFAGDLAGGIFALIEPTAVAWNRTIDLGVCLILIALFHGLITLQRQLERRVADRTAALLESMHARRQLEHELLLVAAHERNSFGQELHDDICQHLVGTALAAKVLASHLAVREPAASREAEVIVGLLEAGADKTRKLARGLLIDDIRPAELGEKLAQLAAEARGAGVACRFREAGDTTLDHAEASGHLFRIAQEAVRNALRHAAPRQIEILLHGQDRLIVLTVTDDGRGLPPPAERGAGMGLRIMSHRATYAGGELSVGPGPAGGTTVRCRLPRHAAPE
jgi:signal transduction histidine kinase